MKRPPLLSRERIEALRRHVRDRGRLPSFRELGALFGYTSPNAATRFYRAAEEAGFVRRDETGTFLPATLLTGLRCYGSISAGFPSPAEDELCDIISLDEYLIGRAESSFLVRVSGDSMIGAGVMPGDIIVVERGGTPRPGEIVVAEVDGEWTLKFYLRDKNGVYLRAANPKYPDFRAKENLTIGGVVRSTFRRYGA